MQNDRRTADQLLERGRSHSDISLLNGREAKGAEGYFQAFKYVAGGNPRESLEWVLERALSYLANTATDWYHRRYRRGARIAERIMKELVAD